MISSASPSPHLRACSPHNGPESRIRSQSLSTSPRFPPPRPAVRSIRMEDAGAPEASGATRGLSRDASTQYSPPVAGPAQSPLAGGKRKNSSSPPASRRSLHNPFSLQRQPSVAKSSPSGSTKDVPAPSTGEALSDHSAVTAPAVKRMPVRYELCESADLVRLISSMLMELIRFNDDIPLADGSLTRFHSRTPPAISVQDYLQRLTTHATLSPPILLSMVYYIDRMCALYPTFTISSLTVHRFLIASATVASKGLSDSFWTNNTYARVGGVSLKELALLELEFLRRVEWRIVPKPEVLVDYYRSLVERSEGFELEPDGP